MTARERQAMQSPPNRETLVANRDGLQTRHATGSFNVTPKHKRAPGAPPPDSPARVSADVPSAVRLASYAKALGDPIRIRLVEVLARHPGELCAGELLPLFGVAKSTLSHHLKTLADAGIIETRHQGTFAYYLVHPHALADLAGWLGQTAKDGTQRAGAEHPPQVAKHSVTFPELITDQRGGGST